MADTHSVLSLLAGDSHGAIEAEAARHALEQLLTEIVPELVLPAATHSVLVHCARGQLHLEQFFPAHGTAEALPHVVLGGREGAALTFPAVGAPPWLWTVIVQVGPFVALGTADGMIVRVVVFSLGTQTIPLLRVPKGRDQANDT